MPGFENSDKLEKMVSSKYFLVSLFRTVKKIKFVFALTQ